MIISLNFLGTTHMYNAFNFHYLHFSPNAVVTNRNTSSNDLTTVQSLTDQNDPTSQPLDVENKIAGSTRETLIVEIPARMHIPCFLFVITHIHMYNSFQISLPTLF